MYRLIGVAGKVKVGQGYRHKSKNQVNTNHELHHLIPTKWVFRHTDIAQMHFHEIILTSELYTTKGAAENGIASVQVNSPLDERYEKKDASNGKFYFNLKAANHQIIGTSQMYATTQSRETGIASVKNNGSTKTVKDNT